MENPELDLETGRLLFARPITFRMGVTKLQSLPPDDRAEVAFAGRSNVGKSSLMNRLVERKSLVRTSSTPGCTRQVSWFDIEADDGARLVLVDLPGYGYAKRSKSERIAWVPVADLRHALAAGDIPDGPTLATVSFALATGALS